MDAHQNLPKLNPFQRFNRGLGQKGFTLIEAMILATILSITVVTFSTWSLQRARQIKANELRRKNSQTATSIQNSAMQAESLTRSEELMYNTGLAYPSPSPY